MDEVMQKIIDYLETHKGQRSNVQQIASALDIRADIAVSALAKLNHERKITRVDVGARTYYYI